MLQKSNFNLNYFKKILNTKFASKNNDTFEIDLKLELPTRLSVDEIIFRIGTSSQEDEIAVVETLTESAANKAFKNLIKFDESFREEFRHSLSEYIQKLNAEFHDQLAKEGIEACIEDEDKIKEYWVNLMKAKCAKDENSEAQLMTAHMYHSLVHSGDLGQAVLERERAYALDLNNLINERNKALKYVEENNLSMLESERAKWSSRLGTLKNIQQRKFKKFVRKLHESQQVSSQFSSDDHDDDNESDALSQILSPAKAFKANLANTLKQISLFKSLSSSPKLEESYTIQLGAQLKTTHNLRLIRCDIYEFCKDRFNC